MITCIHLCSVFLGEGEMDHMDLFLWDECQKINMERGALVDFQKERKNQA